MKLKLLLEQLELLVEKKDHLINKIDSLTSAQKDEIISFFQKYPQHESKINWNKLKELTYDDFKKVMEVPDTIPIKSGEAVEGTDYLEVDSLHQFHKAFIPLTWKGSKYLASNAVGRMEGEWCIAYEKSNAYWKSHFKDGVFIIYVTTEGKYAIKISRPDFTEIDSLWSKKNKDIGAKVFNEETGNDALKLIAKNKKHFSHTSLIYSRFMPDEDGNIYVENMNLTSLGKAPKKIKGNFYCLYNDLKSLEGCPKDVGGGFDCSSNNIESLKEGPQKVGASYICSNNKLKSLEGCPKRIGGAFMCDGNPLESLEGAPQEIDGNFYCARTKLKNLIGAPQKGVYTFNVMANDLITLEGAPEIIGGDFLCAYNDLESLTGVPKEVKGDFYCSNNKLRSLEGSPIVVHGNFYCQEQENGHKFTEEEVRAVCDVKGKVMT